MTLTVRLELPVEQSLALYAKDRGLSKSEVVKHALDLLFKSNPPRKTPYEAGKHLFGKWASGNSNASEEIGDIYKAKVRAKLARR